VPYSSTRFNVVGMVTCLETSCGNVRINLVPRAKASDGGKKEGLGSLSAYRVSSTVEDIEKVLDVSLPE
jgi:hypothetical protein